jgi:thiosulfate dehydrogenase [quinone] large subunit
MAAREISTVGSSFDETETGVPNRSLAFAVFRLTLGVNILLHGVTRIFGPGAAAFAATTQQQFSATPLPQSLVFGFLSCVPFVEAVLGLLTALGLLTRWALAAGGLLITMLVFGTALRSDWASVGNQMIYAICYYLLTANCHHDSLSVDRLLERSRSTRQKELG